MRARDCLVASIVFGVSLAACATPRPIIQLVPAGGDVTWIAGRAVLSKQQSDVRVAVAFEHQHGDRLALRVEVANEGETDLEVGPPDVSYVGCKGTTLETCGLAQGVVDPERQLRTIDENSSRQIASAANDAAFYTPLLILSLAGSVASVAAGTATGVTRLQTAALVSRMESKANEHDRAMASYASQRAMWSNAALRRNTVQPGGAQGGLVFIPIDIAARYVWIHLRVGSLVFPFRFEQTITPVSFPPVQSPGRTSHNGSING